MTDRKLRVLAIAEEANPEWVSVPLVGWSIANELRKHCDLHLVTQIRNREAIEREGLVHGKDFSALDTEVISKPLWKVGNLLRGGEGKGWTTMRAVKIPAYYYFEYLLWKQFGREIMQGKFDVVHRITPLSPTVPSVIAKRLSQNHVPFVVGPLNGGAPWPKQFRNVLHQEREWLSYIRDAHKILPGHSSMCRYSTAIIAGSKFTLSGLPEEYSDKYFYIPENAIKPETFPGNHSHKKPTRGAIKVCFIGRLVPYKGPGMMIEACADYVRSGKLEIDIVGDGPMKEELLSLVGRLGLTSGIEFHGWVAHGKVGEVLKSSQLLVFPSVREFGGGVVLEAMALGIVPLIVDYAGPGELVTEKTGFKVPMQGREEIVNAIKVKLGHILLKPEVLPEMSRAGIRRIKKLYTWEVKARQIMDIYKWAMKPGSARPRIDFGEQ